nr:STAS domain-containing protein [Streptomyces pseudovenezuelae]
MTLAGEMDLTTARLVTAALTACLQDVPRTTELDVDVDLTAVTFCDAGGLNAFLAASRQATDTGATLKLHYPPPIMTRIIEITGSGHLLEALHRTRLRGLGVRVGVCGAGTAHLPVTGPYH